jgi:hypothetical protein
MKLLTTAIFASIMAISTAACAKEELKKATPAVVEAPKAAAPVDVKKDAAPETVRVCVDVKDKAGQTVIDPKTKQPKQNCRTVKKHKKLENTTVVPDGKKK